MEICHDCDARANEFHQDGCDVERCAECGFQKITCGCENVETRMPWTGEWPGLKECREYGFFVKIVEGQGRVSCDKDDPDITKREDLNRLVSEAVWDKVQQKFVLEA